MNGAAFHCGRTAQAGTGFHKPHNLESCRLENKAH